MNCVIREVLGYTTAKMTENGRWSGVWNQLGKRAREAAGGDKDAAQQHLSQQVRPTGPAECEPYRRKKNFSQTSVCPISMFGPVSVKSVGLGCPTAAVTGGHGGCRPVIPADTGKWALGRMSDSSAHHWVEESICKSRNRGEALRQGLA